VAGAGRWGSAALHEIVAGHADFVIKPTRGSGGKGILVVTGRSGKNFRLSDGSLLSSHEIEFHLSNIIAGIFSLGSQADRALIEYRVNFDRLFERITYRGVPDVRIIVFLGIPVMAMVRLPTRMSQGKANLHQGAIGAGIDIRTGLTLTAVQYNSVVTEHPDTGQPVMGFQIPYWDRLLDIASRTYELTGLGYQGIDIVIDHDLGPLVLELNARPGLNIQIANREGLSHRLALVEAHAGELGTPADRVAFAKTHFGARESVDGPRKLAEPPKVDKPVA
jgi:alpha-L-glutamate ligase-like protein